MEYDLELDTDGLAHYLANHPEIKGIGPVKARLIAERFGKDLDQALIERPEAVAEAARLSLAAVERLRDEWRKTREVNKAITWLAAFGLTHHQVASLVKKLGNNVLGMLKADPYLIVREVRGFGFKRVDKIARKMGTPKEHDTRIRAGLLHCVEESLNDGDCWVEYEELVDRANTLLVMDVLDSRERIEKSLDSLIEDSSLSCISWGGRFLVAKPEIRRMEEDLAATLAKGKQANPHFDDGDDLRSLISRVAPQLNQGQRDAVYTVLKNSISVISGGAGSGKTFTVSSVTNIFEEHELRVVLAAPTGKAAKRLEQVVGHSASTIHRLLGFNGKTYARGPEDPIDADVIIIDEVSMVDIPLAWHLFRTIDLERTAVVLVGDHNQLPPVGPGNMLRDLTQSRAVPMVLLDTVVRQAGVLKENCIAVLSGEVRKTSEPEDSNRRAWYVVDQFTDQTDAQRFLLELFENVLDKRLRYDLREDVQVLTPTHKGPLGTKSLNSELQRLIQKKLWDVEAPVPKPGRRPKFLLHDKVIQTRNNYDLGVMNGAMGNVIRIDRDGSMAIEFDGVPVDIESGSPNMQDLQLAYALTIHKAQGSEFPCAIVVVHKAHSFMHHRNLLYTGVTRARKTAVVIGDRWGIQNCARKRRQDERKTFLSLLLTPDQAGPLNDPAVSVELQI
ncbi:ATP-dependent RecD-like DNA helicase [Desulfosarcina ovata subsp. ovata]|uniref:ATP-dependent RecD-like DNA helicase n=2 Tax=Desulfosarcina ovata TaxID=83564 RepID=A0A5K8ABF9_9BACT|nr:ATP-dependent RecD-like DNA helicase [Desulfosarcina ovata subsp. ovata]